MLLNCLILIRCGKNGSHISPRNDDLLVGRPKVPPLPSLFESAVSMGALGKFEVVLGYVVEYVNSPFCQGIVENYFVSSKSECDRKKALTPLLSAAKRLNDWND
jgi:hypothetical protein